MAASSADSTPVWVSVLGLVLVFLAPLLVAGMQKWENSTARLIKKVELYKALPTEATSRQVLLEHIDHDIRIYTGKPSMLEFALGYIVFLIGDVALLGFSTLKLPVLMLLGLEFVSFVVLMAGVGTMVDGLKKKDPLEAEGHAKTEESAPTLADEKPS